MSEVVTLTQREDAWKRGKRFFTLDSINIPASGIVNYVLDLNGQNGVIEFVEVTSDAASIIYETFAGTVYTAATGTNLNAIPRNSLAETESTAQIIKAPTITNDGLSFAPAVELIAQSAAGGRNFIDTRIVGVDFATKKNTNYMIRFTNGEAAIKKLSVVFSYRNE